MVQSAFKQSLIDNDAILLQAEATEWQQAIKLGTDLLVASGAIEPCYYQEIIKSIEKLGPYIIIAPYLAMPHARPENGVNRTAFALVTLKKPVYFKPNSDPVDVLITLAGHDASQHITGLVEITKVIEDEHSETGINLDKLRNCRNNDDVYMVIDQAIQKV